MEGSQILFQFEYLTGAIRIFRRVTFEVVAVNTGEAAATVRVLGFRGGGLGLFRTDQFFDSDVDSVGSSPTTGVVPPGSIWKANPTIQADEFGLYWFRIRTTSQTLVPTLFVQEFVQAGESATLATYTPGDFTRIRRRGPDASPPPDEDLPTTDE